MTTPDLTRRRLLTLAAGGLLAGRSAGRPAFAAGADRPRLAAIDWAMLETAVAIGHMPVAACELIRFRADAVTPAIPAGVVDLGLRGAPNFELLQLIRPDLILTSPYYVAREAQMRAIAPVMSLPFYVPGEAPLPKALAALDALALAVGDPGAGMSARARADAGFDAAAARIAGGQGGGGQDGGGQGASDRAVCVINIGDARHFRAFGPDSLFGNVLTRIGLRNAWDRPTQFAFLAPVPIETLAEFPDASIVIVSDVPVAAARSLGRSAIWRALPAVAAGRVRVLPDVSAFGGVLAALRFAELVSSALVAPPNGSAL
nr:ABC transporter substrate-binding protein [Paracoccus marinus]